MPSQSLSDVTQNDWIRACEKLGLRVEKNHGKGSHVLVKHPANNNKYTIQRNLYKQINQKIFNLMKKWGFSEEQIWGALR